MGDETRRLHLQPVRSALLAWYDEARRDLPWRDDGSAPDPYRTWVSEVMLQQTRVETVRPYFLRWMERFPTVDALAGAPLDDVLKAWEGLGYYSRARNLHRAAREIAERHGGAVPDDRERFRALPGVGRYTAGAVLSIAFGRPEPVVDGNVRRVFARLLDLADPADADLWRLSESLVAGIRPGDLNQAVMELGATVCTPRSPRCDRCPVRAHCAASAAGVQEQRPLPRRRGPLPLEQTATAVLRRGDCVLLGRRRLDVRLGGLWEFPAVLRARRESASRAAERALREGLGIDGHAEAVIGVVDHTFTHVRVRYTVVRCDSEGDEPRALGYDECAWVDIDRIGEYALPAAQKRIAALALESTPQRQADRPAPPTSPRPPR